MTSTPTRVLLILPRLPVGVQGTWRVGGLWAEELCSFHLVPHQGPPSTCWKEQSSEPGKDPSLRQMGWGKGIKS